MFGKSGTHHLTLIIALAREGGFRKHSLDTTLYFTSFGIYKTNGKVKNLAYKRIPSSRVMIAEQRWWHYLFRWPKEKGMPLLLPSLPLFAGISVSVLPASPSCSFIFRIAPREHHIQFGFLTETVVSASVP